MKMFENLRKTMELQRRGGATGSIATQTPKTMTIFGNQWKCSRMAGQWGALARRMGSENNKNFLRIMKINGNAAACWGKGARCSATPAPKALNTFENL